MNTSTAATNAVKRLVGALTFVFVTAASANMVVTPWTPIFKGIDRAVGTNYPDSTIPRLQVANCVRIDLTDPDVQLFATPRASGYVAESRETTSLSVSNFIRSYGVKVAASANFYIARENGVFTADPHFEGLPCEVYGLLVSTGVVVSIPDTGPDSNNRYASILFTTNKIASLALSNAPPGTNLAGIYTAVTGYYPVLTNGVVLGSILQTLYPDDTIHDINPRSVFGLSQDRRYLFMMVVDGRQGTANQVNPPYSDGALDGDSGLWLLQFGAWDGVNMDGGGSAALYMADCIGNPLPLGHSSYLGAYNRERFAGCHLGVFAAPLPGFINDVAAARGSITATVTWTTLANATSQVEFGVTTNFGNFSPLDSALTTNHSVTLSGLNQGTRYYYRVHSQTDTDEYVSSCGLSSFVTTNVGVSAVFGLTNDWKFETNNLDGVNWTSFAYDDSGWTNHGPGALWADDHPENFPSQNAAQIPNYFSGTRMPVDPATGYPFNTYYFRTHFIVPVIAPGVSLTLSNFIDDGAVFYLNGVEIYRTNMIAAPTLVRNSSNAIALIACSGNNDATCPIMFTVGGNLATNLLLGTNVLAVEVHNFRPLGGGNPSHDLTFECALFYTVPPPPALIITNVIATAGETNVTITWTTTTNATTQLQYGLTPGLSASNTFDSTPVTSHGVALNGLQPLTTYYFRVLSSAGGYSHFVDGSFVTVPFHLPLVTFTNVWKFTTNNLNGTNWTAVNYNDSGWIGQGPALLYIEDNVAVSPRNTPVPARPNGFPFTTYYFRTHFNFSGPTAGFSMLFTNFIDDGAVLYLNGSEIQRIRMPAGPVVYADFSSGCPPNNCETTSDVPDVFRLSGDAMTNLVNGNNVLAAEVHQRNASSTDIVFGSALGIVRALVTETSVRISQSNNIVCISWDGAGFTLQRASGLAGGGAWSDVPGPIKTSPYCTTNSPTTTFYRLRN